MKVPEAAWGDVAVGKRLSMHEDMISNPWNPPKAGYSSKHL